MRLGKYLINEQANTLGADVNEIMFGYFVLGGTWKGFDKAIEAKKHVETRKGEIFQRIGDSEYDDQVGRAKQMALDFIKWCHSNGYTGVKKVWWTARAGVLAKAVGRKVDSKKNPTDILIQFNNGDFLGVSAKSTKTSGDITFKNPGLGTVSKQMKMSPTLVQLYKSLESKAVEMFNLPKVQERRKELYKSDPDIKEEVRPYGREVLGILRDALHKELSSMNPDKARDYILNSWMDSSDIIYPPYVKVTGHGKKGKFKTTIMDPLKNKKKGIIMKGVMHFEPVASDTIGVKVDDIRIIKMRFKFKSGPFIGIAMVGDPWK